MANLIKSLPFIGRNYKKILRKAKITTTEEFLKLAVCRTNRQNLSNGLGISKRLISKWVNQADLLRVKGIGPKYLKLLNKININGLIKLSKQYPEDIFQKINSLDQEDIKKIKRKPSEKLIKKWVEESRKTKKVIQNLSDDLDILEAYSGQRAFSLYEIILDLINSREWECLINVGLRIKRESVFNVLDLKFESEEQKEKAKEYKKFDIKWARIEKNILKLLKNEKTRQKILEQISDKEMRLEFMKFIEDKLKGKEQSKKRQLHYEFATLFDFEEKLKDDLFLYFLSNFIILIAKLHLALERKKPNLNEVFGKDIETDVNKLLIDEKIKEIKEKLQKIKACSSMLPRQMKIMEMDNYSIRICDLIIKLKKLSLENRNIKINKLTTKAYQLYQSFLLNCLFWLYNHISDKKLTKKRGKKDLEKLGINFPENKDILRKDDFDYFLIKKIYSRYKIGGKL